VRSSTITRSDYSIPLVPSFTLPQEYKDVKEKAEQLVPLLKKLKDNFTTVADGVDPEEEQRRTELSR
jgi:hypothetical protein